MCIKVHDLVLGCGLVETDSFFSGFTGGTLAVGVDLVSIESNPPITIPARELSSDEIGFSRYARTGIEPPSAIPKMHNVRVTQLIVGLFDSPLFVPFMPIAMKL